MSEEPKVGSIAYAPDYKSKFWTDVQELEHLRIANLNWMDLEEIYQAFKARLISECYQPQLFDRSEK